VKSGAVGLVQQAAAIQTEVAMALKRLDSISTTGKEHLVALQAQVDRHDEKI